MVKTIAMLCAALLWGWHNLFSKGARSPISVPMCTTLVAHAFLSQRIAHQLEILAAIGNWRLRRQVGSVKHHVVFSVVWVSAGRLTNISLFTTASCSAQPSVTNHRKGSSLVHHCHSGLVSSFCTSTPLPPSLARPSPEELSPPGGFHGEVEFGQSTSSEEQVEQQMALCSHAPCSRFLRQAGDTDKLLTGSPEALLTFTHPAVRLLLENETRDSFSLYVWMQWSGRLCTDQWRARGRYLLSSYLI